MLFDRFNFILLKTRVNIYKKNLLKFPNPPMYNTNTRAVIAGLIVRSENTMVASTVHNQIERNSSVMHRLRATEVNRPTSCIVLNIGEGRAPI